MQQKQYRTIICLLVTGLMGGSARAQYHAYNVPSGSDCIVQDYRTVNAPGGIYDADHSNVDGIGSSDGGAGSYYGGFTHQNQGGTSTLLQYVCWPASGSYPVSYAQQIPSFAGTNMVGYAQIGEGSSCAIKGYWPQFNTNLWYREAERVWQPADGTAHVGYQGVWMKEPVSGNWYHVATFTYPFALNALNGMGGWQENFTGYTGDYKVAHAGGYYHKSGAWQKANQITFTSNGYTYLTNDATYATSFAESDVGPSFTAFYNNTHTVTLADQPASPAFDPILVSNIAATVYGSQLLVQWDVPPASSPQLGYKVEVFTNASYTGTVVASYFNYDPEIRQQMLTLTNVATPYVRLTISDIFYQTNAPILITPATATLLAATNPAGTVGGLAYQYYEAASGNWAALPNFSALTPAWRGVVATPEPSPRKRRINYGFNYAGFFNAPSNGLYAFTLHSGDGSVLAIDGTNVISFDGLHDSSQFKAGGIALAAGLHNFNLQFFKGAANPVNSTAYTDGLGLSYEGPGIAKTDVPAAAFFRTPGVNEPTITLTSPANNSSIPNFSPGLAATVTNNGVTINSVQFLLTDFYSYYARPGAADYVVGQDTSLPFALNSMIWTAPTNLVRARLVYNGTNTIDSAPVQVATTNGSFGAWAWTPLEMHNYPSGAAIQGNTFTMVGDGMNMLSRKVTGDCTFVAHLAGITPNVAAADGIFPDSGWRAGIILRGSTNTTIGQPLGGGGTTRFAALFSSVGGGTYFEDDTMRNGNGDANAWSSNLGGNNKWYKLQRTGDTFVSSVSADGVSWTQVNSTNLTSFGTTIYAGVFIHSLQSMNPNIHVASLDSYTLTGTNVAGPASVSINPLTNSVIGGLAAGFNCAVIGPVPASYQWQLNGTNILNATNATYSIASVAAADVGTYTVVANSVTSAPAILIMSAPAGSGVWTNLNGGSWPVTNNWTNNLVAGGVDTVADFSTLNLSLAPTVTLDGARTNGALIFDDANPSVDHNWTLSTGSGGPLTLATSSGTPNIAVKSATNIISAVLAGTQGFTKTGAGQLTVSSASTITGTISVTAGTLEMQNKSGDTPYSIAAGAKLKIGYSTGGGYASTSLTINGSGASDPSGFYLAGGKSYNSSGQIVLSVAPTTIRQYGSGYANINIFDINGNGLWCSTSASGSASDANIQYVNGGYGMSMQIDDGANTPDFTINGPLNVGNLGFYKRGSGSLQLNAPATSVNVAVNVQGGTVICGTNNCLGTNAAVPVSSGATLALNGFNQSIGNFTLNAGGTVTFGGTNTLTVTNAVLAGTLQMAVNKNATAAASKLVLTAGTLTSGGTLAVINQSTGTLAVGDTFTLFSAPAFAGGFTNVSLPLLPVGLVWDTNSLATAGTLAIASSGSNIWNGGGADNNWNTPANWNGSTPANWNLLYFQGAARTLNTNNLLTSAGQLVLSNGGFTLRGNPLALEWGIVSLAGNNTNAINLTLAAPQSFVCSNGLLAIGGYVTNAGYALTFDGAGSNSVAGVISGGGALVKNGSGTAAISVQQTFTGGVTINAGTLDLTGGGGASGPVRGAVTVNTGGTLRISTGDGFGYNADSTVINPLNIVGGTVNVSSTANQTLGNATINLTGGSITGSASGNIDFFQGNSTLNTLASTNTATISGVQLSPLRQGSTTFTVAAGTTASGIDLDISSVLKTAGSGDATGAIFNKAGAGTMRLNATNTFAKPVSVNAGTLLVNGSLASGAPVTVQSGATLGGLGVINGAVTNLGVIAPGSLGLGKLTISNSVNLAGGTVLMELSKSAGGATTNDQLNTSIALACAGALVVTNAGTNAFALGDSFKIFNAPSYSGNFSSTNLPPLNAPLLWNAGALVSSGTISVVSPPVITSQPQNFTVNSGGSAGFTVGVTGTATLAYQWQLNGTNISGATTATYNIASAQPTNAGNYTVIITNNYGAATSSIAVLAVNVAPTVSAPPQSLTVYVNSNANFSVTAGGTPAPVYQWRFNGTNISGATATNYLITAAKTTNEGNYSVVITNVAGSITSSVAGLSLYREFGRAPAPYPSLLAANGARHLIVPGFQLGVINFAKTDARTNEVSEDGISFNTSLKAGQGATVQIVASGAGYLSGWIDYGTNGSWADAGEQVFTNVVLSAGTNLLNLAVPATAVATTNTWARFRFSSAGSLAVTGEAADGEVEDYQMAVSGLTLTYLAGAHGTLTGSTNQPVSYGGSGSAVTAVADSGYAFTNWSDGIWSNPRTDMNVFSNVTVTANFIAAVNPAPTNIVLVANGAALSLTWPADRTGWQLQVQTNNLSVGLGPVWRAWPGSTATNHVDVPVDIANPGVFLRLVYPPQP
jgi:autotransporter-associated beta strand protein